MTGNFLIPSVCGCSGQAAVVKSRRALTIDETQCHAILPKTYQLGLAADRRGLFSDGVAVGPPRGPAGGKLR